MNKWHGIIMLCLLLVAAACQKKNNNTPYPQISLKEFRPDSLQSGNSADSLYIFFDFYDGDADLTRTSLLKLIDSRTQDSMTLPFPDLSQAVINPQDGLEGSFVVRLSAATIRLRPDSLHFNHGDTLQYTINIADDAGHESNRVVTPRLRLYR